MDITSSSTPAISPEDGARLAALARSLQTTRATVHYVDYLQAERDCADLAAMLLKTMSRDDLASFSFVAIPRGGLIVLGMLSYILDLQPAQLNGELSSGQPLFVIDDCALTGARFAGLLGRIASPMVVFAHLYSHPDLRRAILDREPRVKHCLAAHDLVDHAPLNYPDPAAYHAWRQRRRKQMGTDRYWAGQPDLVCFAWSEPDTPFWNPRTGRLEDGWRFLPPHLCLKNRTRLAVPPQDTVHADLRVPSSVAWGVFDDTLWLCETGSEQVYSLAGVAAAMWRALAAYGSVDAAAVYLLNLFEVADGRLRDDLQRFVAGLLARGLLERVSPGAPANGLP